MREFIPNPGGWEVENPDSLESLTQICLNNFFYWANPNTISWNDILSNVCIKWKSLQAIFFFIERIHLHFMAFLWNPVFQTPDFVVPPAPAGHLPPSVVISSPSWVRGQSDWFLTAAGLKLPGSHIYHQDQGWPISKKRVGFRARTYRSLIEKTSN
jgi:hypothetical protein